MTPQQPLDVEPTSGLQFPLFKAVSKTTYGAGSLTAPFHRAAPRRDQNLQTIRIALAGCGVVGGAFVRLLHDSGPAIASRFGVCFAVTRVLVRDTARNRNLPIDRQLFTDDLDSFLAHDADVTIEAVGGDEPARTIAATALARGQKVISANKELIATHGVALSELALENETSLDFGASVGGSAPVIATLRDLVGASTPLSVRGILNGTSNYIISLIEDGASLAASLRSARELGLAEADPTRDLDGQDTAAKLAIMAWIAFGIRPSALGARRTSLLPGLEQLIRFATIAGGRVRFIGECTQLGDGGVTAAVEPVIVDATSAFGQTVREENRVAVDLGWTSLLSVSGPGAGGAPTAASLLGDLLRIDRAPNNRGAGVKQFISVPDSRDHQWLVIAKGHASALRSEAEKCGLREASHSSDGAYASVITCPAPWGRVQRLIAELHRIKAHPCVARYELSSQLEARQ
ncbi:MAG: homoserine dehydrogenase [Gemmatimonadaceae bacterium]